MTEGEAKVLLGGVISECEQVGIPTLTPSEVASLKLIKTENVTKCLYTHGERSVVHGAEWNEQQRMVTFRSIANPVVQRCMSEVIQ